MMHPDGVSSASHQACVSPNPLAGLSVPHDLLCHHQKTQGFVQLFFLETVDHHIFLRRMML